MGRDDILGICFSCSGKKSYLFLFDCERDEFGAVERKPVAFIPCPLSNKHSHENGDHGPLLKWRAICLFDAVRGYSRFYGGQGDRTAVPWRVQGTSRNLHPPGPESLSAQFRMSIQSEPELQRDEILTENATESEAELKRHPVTQAHLKTSIKDVQRLIEGKEDPNSIALALGQMESERETLSGGTKV